MRRNSSLISQGRFSFLSVRNVFALIYSVVRHKVSFQLKAQIPLERSVGHVTVFFFFFNLYLFSFFFFHSYENILSNIAMKTEWIIPKCLSQILSYKADAFLFPQCNDFMGYSSKSLKIFVLSVLVQTHAVWQRTCWPLTSCGILQYRKKIHACHFVYRSCQIKRDSVFKN